MQRFDQSPTDPGFVQNPYPFYDAMRSTGDLAFWSDYDLPCAASHKAVHTVLRDHRFGREIPPELVSDIPDHLAPFYAVEAHSMLELEPPRHTRLRSLVLRAFTSRRIKTLKPDIYEITQETLTKLPQDHPIDLLRHFCQPIPVRVIARLLGVPEEMSDQLLSWSHAMVAMYQARRDRSIEDAASKAAQDFGDFLRDYVERRRADPQDDLITELIRAEEDGNKLSPDELITTCILLLNAGHEATVHTLGNGIKTLLKTGHRPNPTNNEPMVEEILRYDPPLHMFTRYVYEDLTLFGHEFTRGDQIALLLAAANRDPAQWQSPNHFDPNRTPRPSTSFGGGLHFCVGAPLARLEMQIALTSIFDAFPNLRLTNTPTYANSYHFHGLERLEVTLT